MSAPRDATRVLADCPCSGCNATRVLADVEVELRTEMREVIRRLRRHEKERKQDDNPLTNSRVTQGKLTLWGLLDIRRAARGGRDGEGE